MRATISVKLQNDGCSMVASACSGRGLAAGVGGEWGVPGVGFDQDLMKMVCEMVRGDEM